jgi:hypothetical protein
MSDVILTDEQVRKQISIIKRNVEASDAAWEKIADAEDALLASHKALQARCEALEAASKVLGEAITAITYGNPLPEDFLIRRGEYWRNAVNSMREQSESHWHYLRRLDFEIAEVAWNEYITMLQASQQPDGGEA